MRASNTKGASWPLFLSAAPMAVTLLGGNKARYRGSRQAPLLLCDANSEAFIGNTQFKKAQGNPAKDSVSTDGDNGGKMPTNQFDAMMRAARG